MADYPISIYEPTTKINRAGVTYDPLKTKIIYAEDFNKDRDEIVAIERILGLNPEGSFTSVVLRLDDLDDSIALIEGDLAGVVYETDVQTLTNKRITPRIGTTASSATPTPSADDYDVYTITALAEAAVFGAPTGTAVNGQKLIIRIKDNGTARALSFNAIYRASSDLALPTTTVLSKTLYLGFIYNSADSKWDLIALLNNF